MRDQIKSQHSKEADKQYWQQHADRFIAELKFPQPRLSGILFLVEPFARHVAPIARFQLHRLGQLNLVVEVVVDDPFVPRQFQPIGD